MGVFVYSNFLMVSIMARVVGVDEFESEVSDDDFWEDVGLNDAICNGLVVGSFASGRVNVRELRHPLTWWVVFMREELYLDDTEVNLVVDRQMLWKSMDEESKTFWNKLLAECRRLIWYEKCVIRPLWYVESFVHCEWEKSGRGERWTSACSDFVRLLKEEYMGGVESKCLVLEKGCLPLAIEKVLGGCRS